MELSECEFRSFLPGVRPSNSIDFCCRFYICNLLQVNSVEMFGTRTAAPKNSLKVSNTFLRCPQHLKKGFFFRTRHNKIEDRVKSPLNFVATFDFVIVATSVECFDFFPLQRGRWPHGLLHRPGHHDASDRGQGGRQRVRVPKAHQEAEEPPGKDGSLNNSTEVIMGISVKMPFLILLG